MRSLRQESALVVRRRFLVVVGLLVSGLVHAAGGDALFATTLLTMIPAVSYSGLIDPVSSLEGFGRTIGEVYPASHMIAISRGVFSKALGFRELAGSFGPLLLSVPAILGLAIALTRKQEN